MTAPPPIAPDVDIRDFAFTPMFRARLFGSSFHARASDSEWRAGVTLWLKSWDQVPAGSLPDDDVDLCRLAELGRDLKTWKKIKAGALHGWNKCADGRLYHSVVAEGVNEAWKSKLEQRWRSECGRVKKHNQRHVNDPSAQLPMPTLEEFLSRRQAVSVPGDNNGVSLGTGGGCPETVPEETPSKRQGQGQGLIAVAGAPAYIAVGYRVMDMIGVRESPNWFGDASPAERWLAWGADPELDIYPTVDRVMRKRRATNPSFTPRTLGFFDDAISEALARRLAPRPEVSNVNGTRSRPAKPSLDDQFAELDRLCANGPGPLEPFGDAAAGPIIDNPAQRH